MAEPEFVIETDPSPEQLRDLEDRLYAFNAAAAGIDDGLGLSIMLRAGDGAIIAGLAGHTWGGTCEVRLVWVEPPHRKQGLGTRLLQAAEDEARRRGCTQLVLSTHSFQAPELYRRRGYVQLGAIDDYPRGHQNILLRKAL